MPTGRNKTEVVIIGGGAAGATLARKLSSSIHDFDPEQHNLTLITPHPYHILLPACARMVVTSKGSLEDTALIPLDKLFDEGNAGKVVRGSVARIVDGAVELENKESIPYNYLVIATGCSWDGPLAFPGSDAKLREHLRMWRAKFANAKRIVIVGGGAVGIELASEVKAFYPEKEVTLVHAGSHLLNDAYPVKFRKATTARVIKFGINLVLDDKLDIFAEGASAAMTARGQKLFADLFVSARGPKPNTAILKSLDPSIITSSGHVKVLSTLHVPLANNKTNVFAAGDIIDWNEQHQAIKAAAHADVVATNILGAINQRSTAPVAYQGFMEAIMITIGPKGGIMFLPKLWGLTFGDCVVALIKSGGLFITRARKQFGY